MKLKISLLFAAALLTATAALAQSPKREMRNVWVAGMGIDWPTKSGTTASRIAEQKKELTDYLDHFKEQNFTAICLHVRPRADAYYKSSYEPWSQDLSGTRGKDPGWDPLAFAIEECHKRGIEIYAWVNPFRVNANNVHYNTAFDQDWEKRGIIFKNKTWWAFNPGMKESREHCLNTIKEIYTNYMIDGLLFDDYFYPGDVMPKDNTSADWDLYKSSGTTLSLGDWRRQNINTFVKELYDDIQASRPDMRFGIGPAGVSRKSAYRYNLPEPQITSGDWMYDDIYCDPLAWMEDGSIDFIAPQIYWQRTHSTAPFEPLADWWAMVAKLFGIHNYVSMASYKVSTTDFGGNNTTGWGEMEAQVNITRKYATDNAPGAVYYNCSSMNNTYPNSLGDYLGTNVYQLPSLTPVVNWKNYARYDAPANLTLADGKLSWTAVKGSEKAIIRYTVYAVPTTVDFAEAQMADGDGISNQYLLGVTYDPSYTLPADKTSNYWYAVCVYDGYGNEHEPALNGIAVERAQSAAPVSPAAGVTAQWNQTMTWSSVPGTTYMIQLATDAEFHNVVTELKNITTTSATVDFSDFADATSLLWRVVTVKPGLLKGYSEARAIVSPTRKPAIAATLVSPADNFSTDESEITFSWTVDQPADTRTPVTDALLEVAAAGNDFADILISASTTANGSVTVASSKLGEGDFEWRVTTSGKTILPTISAVRHLNIHDLRVGGCETGYTMKQDQATYPAQDNLQIENLWMRKTVEPFSNMSFDQNGLMTRGMVASGNFVYVSRRSEGSASADLFLDEYSAASGERIRSIQLSEGANVAYLPCNDVIKDSKGNICITNLSLNSASTPLYVHMVDLQTGQLTEVAKVTGISNRVDHMGIYGDVSTGNFTLFAIGSSSAVVMRWEFTDGKAGNMNQVTIRDFYPATSTHFGIAPHIYPVSNTLFYADGGATAWTLYNFSSPSKAVASFRDNTSLAPQYPNDNGAATFTLAGRQYAVYANEITENAGRFSVVSMDAPDNFTSMKELWRIPRDGMGTVLSSHFSTPVDALAISPSAANIYLLSPGNGLAAYRITDTQAAVDDITADETPTLRVVGHTVIAPAVANTISAYTLTGACIATAANTDRLDLPAPGTYLISATTPAGAHTTLLHIR